MPFLDLRDMIPRNPFPGCRARFVHSDNMTLAYWEFESGAEVPEHAHPHEQVVNLIEGEFELSLEGDARILKPGMVVLIPPNTPHSGRAMTSCRIIDAFHPVREDLR